MLLQRIRAGRCTPFLGAGAAFPTLPLGKEIAHAWAEEHRYPLGDSEDLAKVAQFLAVEIDPLFPKELLGELFKQRVPSSPPPILGESDEPHRVLASLPLPAYITTNYDDFMFRALELDPFRDPRQEFCRWNPVLENEQLLFASEPDYEPTVANPLVFHLHGTYDKPESMVLTEDDYLDFLWRIAAAREDLLPPVIQRALAVDSLLFIGYSLSDWNLRVLLRGLRLRGRSGFAVLLPPSSTEPTRERAQDYLTRYYRQLDKLDLRIYWGTAREFSAELLRRWQAFTAH